MSNDYYNPSGWPITVSFGASSLGRSEMALIQAGFDKLPPLTGNANEFVRINSTETGMESVVAVGSGNIMLGAENTWTPELTFATPGNLSFVYFVQLGYYTRVGRLVFATFNLQCSALSYTTSSGILQITGLPFAAALSACESAVFHTGIDMNAVDSNTKSMIAETVSGQSYIQFRRLRTDGGGGAGVSVSDAPSGSVIVLRGTMIYLAA